MDNLELVKFLWVVMAVPLGWLFIMINSLKKDLNEAKNLANSAKSKSENAITESRVREILKEEIGTISSDINKLNETINLAIREFDNKIFNLALEAAKSQNVRGDKSDKQ